MKIQKEDVIKEADRLYKKFGEFAMLVCDELIDRAEKGYDYDADFEIPFYESVKKELLKKTV